MKAAQHELTFACSAPPGAGNALIAVPAPISAAVTSLAPQNFPFWTYILTFLRHKSRNKHNQVCIEDSSRATNPDLIEVS
jgi:hypothetical protein